MGFTKLDSGIVDSSVWSEPLATRVVWVTILAKCGQDHLVRCSRSGLRRAANVTEEDFEEAIKTLESPDTESRTKTEDGRRIREVEGGWFVINHGQYRQYSYSSTPEAVRQRKHREKNNDVTESVTCHKKRDNGRDISASASVSSSDLSSLKERDKRKAKKIPLNHIPESFIESARKEILRIFMEGGHSDLLTPVVEDYLISLSWDNREMDLEDEIKGKFAHWTKFPLTDKSNICLQFHNWFKVGRKYEKERNKERKIGQYCPEK